MKYSGFAKVEKYTFRKKSGENVVLDLKRVELGIVRNYKK